MRLATKFFLGLPLSMLSLSISVANAAETFPLIPRISFTGMAGNNDQQILQGDGMLPLWGDSKHLFYTDLQGKTGFGNGWLGSAGVGYRQVRDNARILGAYGFLDRMVSDQSQTFWIFNPGVESLGRIWDLRANGYLPVGQRRYFVERNWADLLGYYGAVSFSGHTQYDQMANLFQKVGPGVDAEVGRTVPFLPGLSAYAGSYYYSIHADNASQLNGAEGRFEYAVNRHLTLNLQDSYDNVFHNTLGVGLRLTLGGVNDNPRDRRDISTRIEDPIQRNMATFMQGNSAPVGQDLQLIPGKQVENSNVWFFNNSASPNSGNINANSCTFEHPCSGADFDQTNLDWIATNSPNADLYLANGSYTINNLILDQGLSIFGRTANYVQPANAADVHLIGSLMLDGQNSVNNVWLYNNANAYNVGITVAENAANVALNNIIVGALNGQQGYAEGILNLPGAGLTINNSTINAYSADVVDAYGLYNEGNAVVTNSNIIADSASIYNSADALFNLDNVTVSNSVINATAPNVSMGIDSLGTATIDNSEITAALSGGGEVYGVVNSGTLNMNNSTVNTSIDGSGGFDFGVVNYATATIDNSVITANSINDNEVFGILSYGTLNLANSLIDVSTKYTYNANSIYNAGGTFNDQGNNICKINGVLVSC